MCESLCNATSPLEGRKRDASNEQQNFSRRIDGVIQVRSNVDSLVGSGQEGGWGELISRPTPEKMLYPKMSSQLIKHILRLVRNLTVH